jgi:hypothetical protein
MPKQMKIKKFTLLMLLLPYYCLAQQGIAISEDGSLPSPTAILEVKSSSKGFLLPRMSQSQIFAIPDPANGLLVFENGNQRLFQYREGQWRYFLNNYAWTKTIGRKWLINFTDSVGIGTAALSERLHVANGNFRLLNGDMKLDGGDIFVNGATGKFQFLTSGLNKAFLQLSSNDLRIGTNSENETGAVRLTSGGLTKVTVDNTGISLSSTSKLTRPETGDYHLAAYSYGTVALDGTITNGTGNFQVSKHYGTGATEYRITVEGLQAYSFDRSVILVTPSVPNVASFGSFKANSGYYVVQLWHKDSGAVEGEFKFVIFKN